MGNQGDREEAATAYFPGAAGKGWGQPPCLLWKKGDKPWGGSGLAEAKVVELPQRQR